MPCRHIGKRTPSAGSNGAHIPAVRRRRISQHRPKPPPLLPLHRRPHAHPPHHIRKHHHLRSRKHPPPKLLPLPQGAARRQRNRPHDAGIHPPQNNRPPLRSSHNAVPRRLAAARNAHPHALHLPRLRHLRRHHRRPPASVHLGQNPPTPRTGNPKTAPNRPLAPKKSPMAQKPPSPLPRSRQTAKKPPRPPPRPPVQHRKTHLAVPNPLPVPAHGKRPRPAARPHLRPRRHPTANHRSPPQRSRHRPHGIRLPAPLRTLERTNRRRQRANSVPNRHLLPPLPAQHPRLFPHQEKAGRPPKTNFSHTSFIDRKETKAYNNT